MTTQAAAIKALLTRMNACREAVTWADQWATSGTQKTAWEACMRSDWMLWLLARTTIDQDDHRLRLMACDFAESVLHLIPTGEDRPRKAIDAARAFCAGTITREEMDAARDAAYVAHAARDAAYAAHAARDAAYAAYAAYAARNARDAAYVAHAATAAHVASVASAARNARDAVRCDQAKIIRRYFPTCPPLQAKYIN